MRHTRDQISKALKAHARAGLTAETFADSAASLQAESDRGTVIIAAAIIEDALNQALRSKLNHLNKKEIDALFDQSGPMGTFSLKIKTAQAFNIISRDTRSEIELIREMRNACAHGPNSLTFRDPFLCSAALSIFSDEDKDKLSTNTEHVRAMFILIIGFLANIIVEGDAKRGAEKVAKIIKDFRALEATN